MNNLKEEKIRKAIWHIKRYYEELLHSQFGDYNGVEIFHLYSLIECLVFIIDDEGT